MGVDGAVRHFGRLLGGRKEHPRSGLRPTNNNTGGQKIARSPFSPASCLVALLRLFFILNAAMGICETASNYQHHLVATLFTKDVSPFIRMCLSHRKRLFRKQLASIFEHRPNRQLLKFCSHVRTINSKY